MALRWGSKKEHEPAETHSPGEPATGGHDSCAEDAALLEQLIDRLAKRLGQTAEAQLGKQLQALAAKVEGLEKGLDALADAGRLMPTPAMDAATAEAVAAQVRQTLRGLEAHLDRLEQQLRQDTQPASAKGQSPTGDGGQQFAATVAALQELRAAVDTQREDSAAALRRLRQEMDERFGELVEYLRPAEREDDAAQPAASRQWQRAILGPALAEDASLDFQRQQLLDGILAGEPGACALAGQLLVFQSSPAEKMPPLLKEIGEAFYRWQSKDAPGTNRLEEALVRWLKRACEEAGIGNSIELVHPGQRFDAARHTASGRGVEITRVLGWVVLREDGKVYTKAAVEVR